jgi:hypothetical protein
MNETNVEWRISSLVDNIVKVDGLIEQNRLNRYNQTAHLVIFFNFDWVSNIWLIFFGH